MTYQQWEHETLVLDAHDEHDAWGYADHVVLARDRAREGCCAAEYFGAERGWRWCGMPISAMVDLEHEGVEPYGVCFQHAVEVASEPGNGSVPIYLVPATGIAVVSLNQIASGYPGDRQDPQPLLVNERVYVWAPGKSMHGWQGRYVGLKETSVSVLFDIPHTRPLLVPADWVRRDRRTHERRMRRP